MKLIFFSLYIIFNFINRDFSNIFLILTLIFLLLDMESFKESIKSKKKLVIAIFVFSLCISIYGVLFKVPLHELDNYFRFLLLIPLLTLNMPREYFQNIILLSSIFALIHFVYSYYYEPFDRYQGTSSNPITYANILIIFFIASLWFLLQTNNNLKRFFLFLSACIFILIYVFTETRGPIFGLLACLIVMINCYKSSIAKYSIFLLLFSFILIPNPVIERMKNISEISFNDSLSIPHQSLRERVFYLNFGITLIKDAPIAGVGPHRIEPLMSEYLFNNKIMNITERDHLHNDFLDVWAKFGLLILLLLLIIYYLIYTSKSQEYDGSVHLATMILVLLLSSQLTQSQFAHHQAITIFISLLFTMISEKNKIKRDD